MKYFCKIRYIGTSFEGYQVQNRTGKRTVQGELNKALETLFKVPCAVTGCSRTDAGVHALMFCLTVELPEKNLPIPPEKLPMALQPYLPPDLILYEASSVCDAFHARYDVKEKTYLYRMYVSSVRDPFRVNRAWQIYKDLDVEKMNIAAGYFVGQHDFSSFMAQGSAVSTTVRTVTCAEVKREGDEIRFYVSADGFLYNMVRIMTGTLREVGEGRRAPDDVKKAVDAASRLSAGETAPPDGLYLYEVRYND